MRRALSEMTGRMTVMVTVKLFEDERNYTNHRERVRRQYLYWGEAFLVQDGFVPLLGKAGRSDIGGNKEGKGIEEVPESPSRVSFRR